MSEIVKLPIGIENFEKIRTNGFYYIDKTRLIIELLNNWGKVNLFTRPRRFGKSLNINMLKYFFEYGCNKALFKGLAIDSEKELCDKYMGNFPVISITLKGIAGNNFKTAYAMLCSVIGNTASDFQFLIDSDKLTLNEKKHFQALINVDESGNYLMSENALKNSLLTLSSLLYKHFSQKVILLIDEYDVPLDKAQQYGYYDEMVFLIQNLFGQALKSNDNLFLAVLTGCLRISKESIFTGLNNLKVCTISDAQFDEHFGFTDDEVKNLLDYYGLNEKYDTIKEWYNGYRFGNVDVYCPWDVINYCDFLNNDTLAQPKAFWVNTSGNDIVRNFIKMGNKNTKHEIENLIEGKTVEKKLNLELTYRDLYKNIDNIWSVLYTTGYLTVYEKPLDDIYKLAIPNKEIRKIFVEQINEWFYDEIRKDTPKLNAFCKAFSDRDASAIENQFSDYLKNTIIVHNTGVRKNMKENFYHGILLGLLSHREDWVIMSGAESGNGYSDILIEIDDKDIGIVIEIKYAENANFESSCENALKQIEKMDYETRLRQDGMTNIIKYGIACYKKRCKVKML